jgi:hypothetical protein
MFFNVFLLFFNVFYCFLMFSNVFQCSLLFLIVLYYSLLFLNVLQFFVILYHSSFFFIPLHPSLSFLHSSPLSRIIFRHFSILFTILIPSFIPLLLPQYPFLITPYSPSPFSHQQSNEEEVRKEVWKYKEENEHV